ncbi:unnamed protein product [Brassica oleracea]
MKFKIPAKGVAKTEKGTVSNGMTFIVELKHDVYTFRWDKEALSFGGITILKLLHKTTKVLTLPHPVDEYVKKNNDSLTPPPRLIKM